MVYIVTSSMTSFSRRKRDTIIRTLENIRQVKLYIRLGRALMQSKFTLESFKESFVSVLAGVATVWSSGPRCPHRSAAGTENRDSVNEALGYARPPARPPFTNLIQVTRIFVENLVNKDTGSLYFTWSFCNTEYRIVISPRSTTTHLHWYLAYSGHETYNN